MYDEIIRDLLNGQDFNFVQIKYGLYKYELIEIIEKSLSIINFQLTIEEKEILKKIYLENVSMLDLDGEKVMLISDTHMGGIYEREDYFKFVFDYCKDNEINYLIHAGDIGDGRCTKDGFSEWFENEAEARENAELVLNNYPTSSEIIQYVIAGNHEDFYKNKDVHFFEELGKKQNVVLMGNRRAYFTVCGYPILLEHDLLIGYEKYLYNLMAYNLEIKGHSHISRFNHSEIYLPTLSHNLPHGNEEEGLPGCVVMHTFKEDDIIKLQFDRIYFTLDDNCEVGPSHVYTLKK